MKENTNNQLALFQFAQPAGNLGRFLTQKDGEKDGRVVRKSVQLAKRKEVAKEFNLSPKKDALELDRKMRELGIELKGTLGREISGLLTDPNFVGVRMTAGLNKDGLRRATFSFTEVKRGGIKVTDEEVAQMLGLTVDEVKELRESQAKSAANKTVDIEVTETKQVAVEAEKELVGAE